jgi:hypothetical protein
LLKYLELDRGEASEGVLRASAVVGVLDPGAPPHQPGTGTLLAAVAALSIRRLALTWAIIAGMELLTDRLRLREFVLGSRGSTSLRQ